MGRGGVMMRGRMTWRSLSVFALLFGLIAGYSPQPAEAQIVTEFSAVVAGGPASITAGPDGNLWFTDQAGRIGRITPAGVVTGIFSVDAFVWLSSYGITAGPDGNLWFTGERGVGVG